MDDQKCCYVDCTETFFSAYNTGIQRVVRNIMSRLEGLPELRGYRFIPVITIGSAVFRVKGNPAGSYRATRALNGLLAQSRDGLNAVMGISGKAPAALREVVQGEVDQAPAPRHRSILLSLHRNIVHACQKVVPLLLRTAMLLDTALQGDSKVTLKKGDTMFLADAFWYPRSLAALRNAEAKRATTVLLVYDIIPISHPSFVGASHRSNFTAMLLDYLKVVDGVISISKYAMDEVAEYHRALATQREVLFDYFHLGADFAPGLSPDQADDPLALQLASEQFFLMVGSIEPRKNHIFVLEAFERLWRQGSDLKLCIVGKVGWKCDSIVDRMSASGYLNQRLFVFNDMGDAGLRYLLNRSCAVIMASIVEGFGLPVVEAMHFGKTLLASDIPVFREIGGDYPLYFPLDDNGALSTLIEGVGCGALKSEAAGRGALSWDQSIQSLAEKVVRMSETVDGARR
jgi:glycosyltransferase involved in cell wall biosynthesis